MFTAKHIKNEDNSQNILELNNPEKSALAKIYLNDGASLQMLKLNEITFIENLEPLAYSDVYASSILFPFANRIQDGRYKFRNKTYEFSINEPGNNNALHGLVYNKTFTISSIQETETFVAATLYYIEKNPPEGFPFPYNIQLEYTLMASQLNLKISIQNLGETSFPFTLGWHPYFVSENLNRSSLHFKSSEKMIFNERMITTGTIVIDQKDPLSLENKKLDDCWRLENPRVFFKTPNYYLSIDSDEPESFLQAYTPPRKNTIAIEPTTGVSDSFNNKIGLKELAPKANYSITWRLQLN
ncbi:aldose 1-epimerase [Gaetbulibacter sp. M240]|uniref:aldose 1-epimerase n=1 Tax=Gaetbulibacter sp. M240 TaxID=3126511 RepID=UPI00374F0448